MRLLLDTQVLVAVARRETWKLNVGIRTIITSPEHATFASAASLWEIAIKTRLGKLDPDLPLERLPAYFGSLGMAVLHIDARHAVTQAEPIPATRDPFDRLLLAQCLVENMHLVTRDRALAAHPLAWRPG